MKPLVIRADAGRAMGYGHVMRCLALAQEWLSHGGNVTVASVSLPPSLKERLEDAGVRTKKLDAECGSLEDANHTAETAEESGSEWIVADGYAFQSTFQKRIKDRGFRLLVLDDNRHSEEYFADIVMNQNLFAATEFYPAQCLKPYTKLLLGARYLLIRKEFVVERDPNRSCRRKVCKVLVTLGGSDPENVTQLIIKGLQRCNSYQFDVLIITGVANPHIHSLRELIRDSPDYHRFHLKTDVDDMPKLMSTVDIAICGGGVTCWELVYMGIPSIVVVLSKNQSRNGEALAAANAVINLGFYSSLSAEVLESELCRLLVDYERRRSMVQNGHRLIDGLGNKRVTSEMLSISGDSFS